MRLALLVLVAAYPAAALDPCFVWETLETPHFQVHYHQGMYWYAQKAARAAELSHQRLVPLLDHVPEERTHIVVQDDTDFANGNASPVLYNLIHAYAAPPDSRSTLADFDDPVYELISHEYTHILHLDTVFGLPAAVNECAPRKRTWWCARKCWKESSRGSIRSPTSRSPGRAASASTRSARAS